MCQELYIGMHLNHCVRCGLTHTANRCHAWNAVCNKCRMVGHFARVCSSTEKRPKSTESRKRDKERMTAFVCRKTAESALPFIHAEDDFIREMQVNTSAYDFGTLKRQLNDMKCTHLRLQDELKENQLQCNVLQESKQQSDIEINKLRNEIQCLHSKLADEQHKFHAVDLSLREKETELRDIKLEVNKIKTDSKGLQEQIGFHEILRDEVIDHVKFISTITDMEFNGPLWRQLEFQIAEIHMLLETKDEEIANMKQTMLSLNARIHQLQNENQDLKYEVNSIKSKKEHIHPSIYHDRYPPPGAKMARRGGSRR